MPRVRFRIQTLMIVIAAVALLMTIDRLFAPGLGLGMCLAVVAVVLLTAIHLTALVVFYSFIDKVLDLLVWVVECCLGRTRNTDLGRMKVEYPSAHLVEQVEEEHGVRNAMRG
jgi:hypothetical protein